MPACRAYLLAADRRMSSSAEVGSEYLMIAQGQQAAATWTRYLYFFINFLYYSLRKKALSYLSFHDNFCLENMEI